MRCGCWTCFGGLRGGWFGQLAEELLQRRGCGEIESLRAIICVCRPQYSHSWVGEEDKSKLAYTGPHMRPRLVGDAVLAVVTS
jgi:hypothetical protein